MQLLNFESFDPKVWIQWRENFTYVTTWKCNGNYEKRIL